MKTNLRTNLKTKLKSDLKSNLKIKLKGSRYLKMMLMAGIISMTFTGCGGVTNQQTSDTENVELLISAAASLKESMEEIKSIYEAEHQNVTLTFSFGGSGALQQQIEQGAPADVFISAAEKQMNALEKEGLIVKDSRVDLLENKVVLITPSDQTSVMSFEDVITDKVGQIGLGEPGSVPVGQYAEEIFTSLGILEEVKAKAVYGKDVKEVLSWVETGNVDAGVVYATDARQSSNINVVCEAPEESYQSAIYPVAVIKDSKHQEEAEMFIQFLGSNGAREIFQGLGFTVR